MVWREECDSDLWHVAGEKESASKWEDGGGGKGGVSKLRRREAEGFERRGERSEGENVSEKGEDNDRICGMEGGWEKCRWGDF